MIYFLIASAILNVGLILYIAFNESGDYTEGRVTDKYTTKHSDSNRIYYHFNVSYNDDIRIENKHIIVTELLYNNTEVGNTITIII